MHGITIGVSSAFDVIATHGRLWMHGINMGVVHLLSMSLQHTVDFALLLKGSRYNVHGMFKWGMGAVRLTFSLVMSVYLGKVHMHYYTSIMLASSTVKSDTSCNGISLHKT